MTLKKGSRSEIMIVPDHLGTRKDISVKKFRIWHNFTESSGGSMFGLTRLFMQA